ncbi:MAG TPA: hypothetical protein VLT88_00905, partial [Desulfosarcina sp.]|nr:hypothetical protein [Desulfosarcina sp.]
MRRAGNHFPLKNSKDRSISGTCAKPAPASQKKESDHRPSKEIVMPGRLFISAGVLLLIFLGMPVGAA